jgi:hypothetical protein
MSDQETIQTSEGPVWIKRYDNGDVSFWTPPRSPQSELVADIVRGRAAWKPQFRCWFAPPVHADNLIEELQES